MLVALARFIDFIEETLKLCPRCPSLNFKQYLYLHVLTYSNHYFDWDHTHRTNHTDHQINCHLHPVVHLNTPKPNLPTLTVPSIPLSLPYLLPPIKSDH